MTSGSSTYTECLDEVASGYIELMLAPPGVEDLWRQIGSGRWRRFVPLGLVLGMALGAFAHFLGRSAASGGSPAAVAGANPLALPQSAPEAEESFAANEPGQEERVRIPAAGAVDEPLLAVAAATRSRVVQRRSGSYRRLVVHGWRRYQQGDFRLAAVAFGRAVHEDPFRTAGYYGLALSLFEQGGEAVALQVLERAAKKIGPKQDLWLLAGAIYQWRGEEQKARSFYQRYLKENPRGAYVRDVRALLSGTRLPRLLPFDDAEIGPEED